MNYDKQNTVPDIHFFAEQYRKRVSMEMFGHENATPADVIEYGNEKSRRASSLRTFGHENATMEEVVAFERRVKFTMLLADVRATLLALRQFRADKFDIGKALAVYASSKAVPPSDSADSELVITAHDLDRLLMEMKWAADAFIRELQVGIHYRVHDGDLINKLFKSLAQIRSLNNGSLPALLVEIDDLVTGRH